MKSFIQYSIKCQLITQSLSTFLRNEKDPEMMREAQKMMNDPAFQARMKQITERPEFKESMTKAQEMMKDEDKVRMMLDFVHVPRIAAK